MNFESEHWTTLKGLISSIHCNAKSVATISLVYTDKLSVFKVFSARATECINRDFIIYLFLLYSKLIFFFIFLWTSLSTVRLSCRKRRFSPAKCRTWTVHPPGKTFHTWLFHKDEKMCSLSWQKSHFIHFCSFSPLSRLSVPQMLYSGQASTVKTSCWRNVRSRAAGSAITRLLLRTLLTPLACPPWASLALISSVRSAPRSLHQLHLSTVSQISAYIKKHIIYNVHCGFADITHIVISAIMLSCGCSGEYLIKNFYH